MTVAYAIIVVLVLLAGGAMLLLLRSRTRLRGIARARVLAAWQKASATENPVLRIVEADKVLDLALTLQGFPGSLGEKLKAAGLRFSDLHAVWSAHKLRNTLVHDLQHSLQPEEAETAMRAFRQGLKDLGA